MERLVFRVRDMTCGHCRTAIEGELAAVEGVAQIEVDLIGKDVTVRGLDLDPSRIEEAIAVAGYKAVLVDRELS